MRKNLIKAAGIALMMACSTLSVAAQANQTLVGDKVGKNVTVINGNGVKFHTFHGISNSHIIETANELRVIDAQMLFPLAKGLKKYIAGLGKPLKQIILSHNHPDHWFGAEILEDMAPIVSSANIINDLKTGGMRYIKIMSKNKKLEGKIPSRAIVPSGELKLGAQNWDGLDVIVEEHPDQESHHSLLIKVPAYGIMIGQDLFYNDRFLVASERSRNKNWQTLLENLRDNESKDKYKTLLVGHGNNGGPEILDEDIEYLKTLEAVLAQGLTQAETKQAMFKKYPNKGGKNFIDISLRNLFSKH